MLESQPTWRIAGGVALVFGLLAAVSGGRTPLGSALLMRPVLSGRST